MKRFGSVLAISFLIINLMINQIFADGDTFTNFTDVDPDQLIDITSSYQLSDIYYTVKKEAVIDSAVSYAYQINFDVSGNHTIALTGSYYDNTITSMQGCSSSSYNYNTSSHTIDGVVTVEPAVYGSLSHSSQNMFLNFGISVESAASAGETITTNSFQNTTQACSLLGMNEGDSAIDGTTLLEAGYQKKTITYNDGSLNGHTATFYVPGNEEIDLDFDGLVETLADMYASVLNSLRIDYHFEYDIWLWSRSKIMPSYGYIHTKSWLPLMLDPRILNYDKSFTNYRLYLDNLDNTSVDYFTDFVTNSYENSYPFSGTRLRWHGTDNPHWVFRTDYFKDENYISSLDKLVFSDVIDGTNKKDRSNYLSSTVQTTPVTQQLIDYNPSIGLTIGYTIPYNFSGIDEYKFYKYQDTSRLNLFNQLGSFLQGQFNRLKSAIDNISGSGDSDIAIDLENDYDVDLSTDIKQYITDVHDRDSDIDLTLPEFTLPSGDALQLISDIPSRTIGIFTSNNLGYMIFLPFIIAIAARILS